MKTGTRVQLRTAHTTADGVTLNPGSYGEVAGVTGHLVAVKFDNITELQGIAHADLIPTDYPILARLLRLGDVQVEHGGYVGLTHDNTWCTLPGSVDRPDQTEAYLRDFPTPGHW